MNAPGTNCNLQSGALWANLQSAMALGRLRDATHKIAVGPTRPTNRAASNRTPKLNRMSTAQLRLVAAIAALGKRGAISTSAIHSKSLS